MDGLIRKYHVRYKDVIYRPEAVFSSLEAAVEFLERKNIEYLTSYGDGRYYEGLEQSCELQAYVYANEDSVKTYSAFRVDYIWSGAFHGFEKLNEAAEKYRKKLLE